MKVRYDDTEIELTERVVESLKAHMRATVAMMCELRPKDAEFWHWGRCEVVDFATAGGIEFTYGGRGDEPDGQTERFMVVAVQQEER